MARSQDRQKANHDRKSHTQSFEEGEEVFVNNYSKYGPSWLGGLVVKCTGQVSARLEVEGGFQVWRHFDQIRKRQSPEELKDLVVPEAQPSVQPSVPLQQRVEQPISDPQAGVAATPVETLIVTPSMKSAQLEALEQTSTTLARRYPLRTRRLPGRLQLQGGGRCSNEL